MSTGIAAAGRKWRGADKPVQLLVHALDHATGYGHALRLSKGQATSAGLSLARTAALLIGTPIYGWFSKGLETRDLMEARALLAGLAVSGPRRLRVDVDWSVGYRRTTAPGASVAFRHRPECSPYCALSAGRRSRGVRPELPFRIGPKNGRKSEKAVFG
jgi:hypothetical protein